MTATMPAAEPPDGLPSDAHGWLALTLGADEAIDTVAVLPGATSSDVYSLTTRTAAGSTRRLVLRWYPAGPAAIGEPLAVAREAAALRALAGSGVPAPILIATLDDEPSTPAGVLMSELPGRPRFDLPDPGGVRDVLAAIHAVDPAPMAGHRYRGYHEDARLDRPVWWQDRPAWERAATRTSTARPAAPDRFIHRDFHPGNLLWVDGRLAGVVDWVGACVGPAGIDVAHCRLNLALLWGPERADDALPGDPAWDIEAAFGILDWEGDANDRWPGAIPSALVALGALPVDAATTRRRLERFVRLALARLG
jgi:aminoglycoside phosphotransferase (APT) family kinase protein